MRRPSLRAGFTLIELMLVVVIIGILASVALPRFIGRSRDAKVAAARQSLVGTLGVALDLFEQDAGRYPTTQEGLAALLQNPGTGIAGWRGAYLKAAAVPKDPWGREYRYRYPSELHAEMQGMYDLICAGPDGEFGTEDDITNYNAGG